MEILLRADRRTNFFPAEHPPNVPMFIQIKHDDGKIVVLAQADCGGIHYFQPQLEDIHIGDVSEFLGILLKEGMLDLAQDVTVAVPSTSNSRTWTKLNAVKVQPSKTIKEGTLAKRGDLNYMFSAALWLPTRESPGRAFLFGKAGTRWPRNLPALPCP